MWFNEKVDFIYEQAVEPAIRECNYEKRPRSPTIANNISSGKKDQFQDTMSGFL